MPRPKKNLEAAIALVAKDLLENNQNIVHRNNVFCARSGTWKKPMMSKNDRHYYSGCER